MDTFLIVLAGIFLITGLAGSVISKLPGTLLCYLGLLVLQYSTIADFSVHFFIKWGVLVIAVQGLDYLIPDWGNRKFGGSKKGVYSSLTGLLMGLYFGPWGIITGAVAGAFFGELFAGKKSNQAIHHAVGSFVLFFLGTISQLIVSGLLIYHYVENLSYVL
ncbi:MAG: DUF456 domain-containing protein [Paludibacter sp.]|nr:DUF456 domain-containing protein [Paludibacter sp.]